MLIERFVSMNTLRKFFHRLQRPEIGSVTLSVLVALYLVVLMNRTFWLKIFGDFHHNIWVTGMLGIIILALFAVLAVTFSVKYVVKPFFILLILVASLSSWFMDQFGITIDTDMMRNIMETTPAEARGFINPSFILYVLVTGVFPALLIAFVRIRHRNWWPKVLHNLAVIVPLLAVVVAGALLISRQLISTMREHSNTVRMLNPVSPITSALKYALAATADRRPVAIAPIGLDARVRNAAESGRKPRVLIIVAGETARGANFSLGGYERPTNPELAKRNVFYFSNTTSCGTATAQSIPCMFSMFPRTEFDQQKGRSTQTLPDVLEHAGIYAEWWDNNTGSKGVANRIKNVIFYNSDSPRFCSGGECQDGIMLDKVGPWLHAVKSDSVLFIHQIGSHGPAYFKRYPEEFRRFRPDCRGTEFNACSLEEIRNAYDNTILYTDYFLSTLIDDLAARSAIMDGALFYMSDHGESLGEGGLFLHGAPYMFAPSQQTHIPFVLWMSPDFAKTAGINQSCLKRQKQVPLSHDYLFSSVLTMMNVDTSIKDEKLDMFARCRNEDKQAQHADAKMKTGNHPE